MIDTLLGTVVPSLAILAAFAIGWVLRGSVEHRRARAREARRRARVEARRTVARPGTAPAKVRQASLSRGRELQTGRND